MLFTLKTPCVFWNKLLKKQVKVCKVWFLSVLYKIEAFSSSLCACTRLTMSLSSTFLCERPGVPAGTPFKRLCCVNRMLMVASSTSDRLCRTCVMQRTRDQGEAAESKRHNASPTSSLKFLKAATLSSTLSWLSGRSFKRSITWKTHTERGGASLKDVLFFAAIVSCAVRNA